MNISRVFRISVCVIVFGAAVSVGADVVSAGEYDGDIVSPSSACPDSELQLEQGNLPTLHKGHYGLSVEYLQSLLGVGVDGCFGPQTDSAVRGFQEKHNLDVDGIVGSCTWAALNGQTVASRCRSDPETMGALNSSSTTVPGNSGFGRRVVLSKSQNTFWLVEADGSVIYTGRTIDNDAKLETGTYWVPEKLLVNYDRGGSWVLNKFVRINRGIGFHEVPLRAAGRFGPSTGVRMHEESILGESWVKSGGCIRISEEAASQLWEFASEGTKVVVI